MHLQRVLHIQDMDARHHSIRVGNSMVHVVGRMLQFCFPGHDCNIVSLGEDTMVNDGTRMSKSPVYTSTFQSGLSVYLMPNVWCEYE